MAFDNLTDKLTAAIKKIRGNKTVSEEDLRSTLREVRLALLEADVNFKVVKEFVAKVRTDQEKARKDFEKRRSAQKLHFSAVRVSGSMKSWS